MSCCSFHRLARSRQVFRRFSFLFLARLRPFICLSLFSASINVFTRSAGGAKTRERPRRPQSTFAEDRGIGKQRGLCAPLMRLRRLLSLSPFIAFLFFSVGYNAEAQGERRGESQIGNWYVDCVCRADREKKLEER